MQKVTQRHISRAKSIQYSEENNGRNCDLGLGSYFLDMMTKALATKEN
jgi:hypothetical protein